MTPTQRTFDALKGDGCICARVERWNQFAQRSTGHRGIRQDLFGIIDIIALDFERGVIGVQSTGQAFNRHHKDFYTPSKKQACIDWLSTPGAQLELWGWRKVKKNRGSKVYVWRPRIKVYTLDDFIDPLTYKIERDRNVWKSLQLREKQALVRPNYRKYYVDD